MNCTGYLKLKYCPPKKIWKNCHFPKFLKFDLPASNSIFSAPPNGQNTKFLCPSDAEFPEFFKTGLSPVGVQVCVYFLKLTSEE